VNHFVVPYSHVPLFIGVGVALALVFIFGGLRVVSNGGAGFGLWFRIMLGLLIVDAYVMQLWVAGAVIALLIVVSFMTK